MNKKLAGIFAMCALLLTGCQGAKESSKEITPPDTGWGKTVDEVLADWNLDRAFIVMLQSRIQLI